MPSINLKAHFNGAQIVLDEPFELSPHVPLIVTVLTETEILDPDRAEWTNLAGRALARASGDVEPEYTAADITER